MVIGYTAACAGDDLVADDIGGEYAVLVLGGAQVAIEHSGHDVPVGVDAVAFVPAGNSKVHITAPGTVVRGPAAPTARSLAASCRQQDYETSDANVAEFAAWPDPPDGDRVRV